MNASSSLRSLVRQRHLQWPRRTLSRGFVASAHTNNNNHYYSTTRRLQTVSMTSTIMSFDLLPIHPYRVPTMTRRQLSAAAAVESNDDSPETTKSKSTTTAKQPPPARTKGRKSNKQPPKRQKDTSSGGGGPTQSSPPPPPPSSSSPIPSRHSRHILPPVCTDAGQLQEWTTHILQAPLGSLFTYQPMAGQERTSIIQDREEAWKVANPTLQQVEAILRGHAQQIPQTQWNRWVKPIHDNGTTTASLSLMESKQTLETMQALVDRLWEEGVTYMTLRRERLVELDALQGTVSGSESEETVPLLTGQDEEDEFEKLKQTLQSDDDLLSLDDDEDDSFEFDLDDLSDEDLQQLDDYVNADGEGEEDELSTAEVQDEEPYQNDFALPGPTVDMYNILLDAMACQAAMAKTSSDTSHVYATSENTTLLLQQVLGRHYLDRRLNKKTTPLPYTLPNVMSYNAAIRIAAEMPYDSTSLGGMNGTGTPQEQEYRDGAIELALSAFDALSHPNAGGTPNVERNSATYVYLLKVVQKYFPPSRIRGNIAHGMFHHARLQGLINDRVVAAHLAVNTPSNGVEFDEWIQTTFGLEGDLATTLEQDKDGATASAIVANLPHKWRRYSRARRYHPREAMY